MQKAILLFAIMVCQLTAFAQTDSTRHEVLLETTMGNVKLALYNETPKHRDNFLKLVKEGFYDGVLFHRVISNFMIQAGDSTTRHAKPGEALGMYSPDYTIPAEIDFPRLYHKRGALAAAREGDDVNPERASSASQFYIVYGSRMTDFQLDKAQERLNAKTQGKVVLTPELRKVYFEKGGTPHLDGQYTVFGEVVEGLDVVAKIQAVETDSHARPLVDVRIVKASLIH